MSPKWARLILPVILVTIFGCSQPAKIPHETDDITNRINQMTLGHWGIAGNMHPKNSWESYTSLKFEYKKGNSRIFKKSNDESFLQLRQNGKDAPVFQVYMVKNSDKTFLYPNDGETCGSDDTEYFGLEGAYVLFMISKAFPEGPDKIREPLKRDIKGGPGAIRFYGGMLTIKSDWESKTQAKIIDEKHFSFEIQIDNQPETLKVDWDGHPRKNFIPDNEPLKNWMSCKQGRPVKSTTGNIKNFGELRSHSRSTPKE